MNESTRMATDYEDLRHPAGMGGLADSAVFTAYPAAGASATSVTARYRRVC